MKKITISFLAVAFLFGVTVVSAQTKVVRLSSQAADISTSVAIQPANILSNQQVLKNHSKGLLFDNGPFITEGIITGDLDSSCLQGSNTTLGAGHNEVIGYAIADDFTVPASGWTIDTIAFFGYQTGSSTTSTFTTYHVQIWSGSPSTGGSVVWGDTTTNVLSNSVFTNVYRGSYGAFGTTRPIMQNYCATSGLSLPAGQYWVEWAAGGSLASGPWCVPVTLIGATTTGDALQRVPGNTWNNLTDLGTAEPLGGTFQLYGTIGIGVQENATQNNLSIYPVPAKDQLNISSDKQISKIKIMNVIGSTVYEEYVNNNNISVNTSSLSNGVYFVRVESTNNIITKKIQIVR